MKKKHLVSIVVVLLLIYFAGQWCWYDLPVKLPLLDEVNESCHVSVLPVYGDMVRDDQEKILSGEEILELKEFLEEGTYIRSDEGIYVGENKYRITITWSDGKRVQLRTFGENPSGYDSFVWDNEDLLLVKPKDEDWHKKLDQLLTE